MIFVPSTDGVSHHPDERHRAADLELGVAVLTGTLRRLAADAMSDRGHRGRAHVLLTPANRYPSRLPWLPAHPVYKLASPRLLGARFAQQLLVLDGAPGVPAQLPSTSSSSSSSCGARSR